VPRRLISIIICTQDRAESLQKTLDAVGEALLPADLAAEVLVVDNGSRDRTRATVRRAKVWGQSPRYIYEPRLGMSNARNAGLAAARGEVLLWTDDDVRPGRHWIEAMCRPILEDRADAVAGRIELPAHLERPWLRPWHRVCLAVEPPAEGNFNLVGANMAFSRRVLDKVPAFDPGVGFGATGLGEDTLFSQQLVHAGFRLAAASEDSLAVHDCGEQRLTRTSLIDVLTRQGRSQAYIDYHWRYCAVVLPALRGGKSWLGLLGVRILHWLRRDRDPVIGRLEARWLWRFAYHRQLATEARRPRQYERFGLEPIVVSYSFEANVARRNRLAA
jgi:glucosyl-dolichyl phosphate glucuronosyltransferase